MDQIIPQSRPRIVLVPFPYQGHITPMLQLGDILHSQGFSVAVAHTEFNSPRPSDYPDFLFLHLPDGLAGSDTSFNNMLSAISDMNSNCKSPFQEILVRMITEEQLVCIVYDTIMHFVDEVAKDLNIPTMVLRTNSAAYVHSSHVTLQLLKNRTLPIQEARLEEPVPGAHPIRFKDLPLPATVEIIQVVQDFTRSYMDIRSSAGVIWNTVEMLDQTPLQQLQHHHCRGAPFFSIGPFHKIAPSLPASLAKEDTSCLTWLDKQAPNSVVYASLGSLATIDKKDLIEMAWGLANSDQPFLWVIRDSLVNGSDCILDFLPEEFPEISKDRGCIVGWAPQKKVLAHEAVGGFLSHCGWNSTLECLSEGVPMICRPCFADQGVNARYISHEWRVGVELEDLERNCMEKAIKKVMVGEEGKGMRERAKRMKQKLQVCIDKGGSSHNALQELVNFIKSFSSLRIN